MKTKPRSKIEQFKSFVREPYAWPGGYPMFAITNDGGCLCKSCASENAALIIRATVGKFADGWQIVGVDVNWEDTNLICDHCNQSIESAYGE